VTSDDDDNNNNEYECDGVFVEIEVSRALEVDVGVDGGGKSRIQGLV
jgi:hypothetical protein